MKHCKIVPACYAVGGKLSRRLEASPALLHMMLLECYAVCCGKVPCGVGASLDPVKSHSWTVEELPAVMQPVVGQLAFYHAVGLRICTRMQFVNIVRVMMLHVSNPRRGWLTRGSSFCVSRCQPSTSTRGWCLQLQSLCCRTDSWSKQAFWREKGSTSENPVKFLEEMYKFWFSKKTSGALLRTAWLWRDKARTEDDKRLLS